MSEGKINTNMTMVELKGNTVKKLSKMTEEERDYTISQINDFIIKEKFPNYIMMLSNELRYFTTFKTTSMNSSEVAEEILNFIETDTYLAQFGELKLIDVEEDHLEIWIEDKFFALFNYDTFVVEI